MPNYRNTEKVEKWLKTGRTITHIQATQKWGLTREQLMSAIATLRRRYDIDTDRIRVKGRQHSVGSYQIVR